MQQTRSCGVYKLSGIRNTDTVKIIPVGLIQLNTGECVKDAVIDTFKITDKVVGVICMCNIIDSYLMSTKKLPMFYVSVTYERPLHKLFLMKLYYYFTITSEIKSVKELIDNPIQGKFSVDISVDSNIKELEGDVKLFPGFKQTIQHMKDMMLHSSMIEIINNLVDIEDEKIRQKYQDSYANLQIPKSTVNLKDLINPNRSNHDNNGR